MGSERYVTKSGAAARVAFRLLPAALLAAFAGCTESPRYGRAPADAAFSVGVADASAMAGPDRAGGVAAPQASGAVKLKFTGGTPSPTVVVAKRLLAPGAITVDGDASDWAGIPVSEVALQSPGTRIGLAPADWYCLWRTRLNLTVDPYTGAAACPTQCDPSHKPQAPSTASQDCTLPVPAYDFGIEKVSVRAAYDDDRIYFLLQWTDPTEDRARRPWSYDPAGAAAWKADAVAEEDRAYLSFDVGHSFPAHDTLGCAAACHLNGPVAAPPPGTPPALLPPAYLAQFTMHTGDDAQLVDSWTWRAASTDPYGLADDQFWSSQRISGDCDDPPACTADCLLSPPGPACNGVASWSWNLDASSVPGLPAWLGAGVSGTGDPDLSPAYLYLAGQGLPGWDPTFLAAPMTAAPSTAPVARATLPGIVLRTPSPHRNDVRAAGRWRDGTWTVEFSRALADGDSNDAQFPLQ